MNKHIKECRRVCRTAGLSVLEIKYGTKHLKIVCAEGTITCGCTPSDWRWSRNLRSIARRMAAND